MGLAFVSATGVLIRYTSIAECPRPTTMPLDCDAQRANVALMPTRTLAYLRVSTEKQADRGVSLDAQQAKVKAYAQLYDLELAEVGVEHSL